MEEKLIPVRDFAELRAGMIVVVKCDHRGCGDTHRGLLISSGRGECIPPRGKTTIRLHWEMAPEPDCSDGDTFVVSGISVARGIVYRVDDGMEALVAANVKRNPVRAK